MDQMKLPKINVGSDLAKIQKEALESLKKDPLVYPVLSEKLGLSSGQVKAALGILVSYQEDVHYCQDCPGLENCQKENPHYQMDLSLVDGVVEKKYRACAKKRLVDDFHSRYLMRAFPEEWIDASLEKMDKPEHRKAAFIKMLGILNGNVQDWLYLRGGHGDGKTYMLACLANDFGKKQGPVVFADTQAFVEKLKDFAFRDKERFDRNFNALCTIPLLVLDSFGDEFKNDFTLTSILYPLLRARARNGLMTCFGSNYKLMDIRSLYEQKVGLVMANEYYEFLRSMVKKPCSVVSNLGNLY